LLSRGRPDLPRIQDPEGKFQFPNVRKALFTRVLSFSLLPLLDKLTPSNLEHLDTPVESFSSCIQTALEASRFPIHQHHKMFLSGTRSCPKYIARTIVQELSGTPIPSDGSADVSDHGSQPEHEYSELAFPNRFHLRIPGPVSNV
jgi:hypothetical protein